MISEVTRREGCRKCPSSIKEIDIKRFGPSILELGRGTYGVVTLHFDESSDTDSDKSLDTVVIKSTIPDPNDFYVTALKSDAVTEIATLSVLQGHPNIVKMIGFNLHSVKISSKEKGVEPMRVESSIVLESAVGSLADLINDRKISGDNELTKKIMYQIIRGMNWMHKNNILHRDLKSDNILLVARGSTEGTIAVTDFGMARSGPFQWLKLKLHVATRWYKAPELYIQEFSATPARYGAPSDVWSVGMIFWDILAPNSKAASYLRGNNPTVQLWKQFRAVVGSFVPETIDYKDFGFSGEAKDLKKMFAAQSRFDCKREHPDMTAEQLNEFYNMWFIVDPVQTTTARERFESKIGRISDDAWDLLSGLLAFNPKDRFSMKDALAHKYFDSIRDAIVENQPTPKIVPTLFEECNSITPKYWMVISRWLWEKKIDVQPAAFFLCLHIMRCLLSSEKSIEAKYLMLYAAASMGLAVLYMEDNRCRFTLQYAASEISTGGWSIEDIIEEQKKIFLKVGTKLHLPTSWVELMKLMEATYSNEEITKLNAKVVASVLAVLEMSSLSLKISASELAEIAFDLLHGKIRQKHASLIEEVQKLYKNELKDKNVEFPKELEGIIMNVKKTATVKDILKAKPATLKVPSRSSTIKRESSMMRATPFSKPEASPKELIL